MGRTYPISVDSIATHMTVFEKHTLFSIAKSLPEGSILVEIGSYHGASSCCLASSVSKKNAKLYCIDTWMNDAVSDFKGNVYPIWHKNTMPYRDIIEPVRGYSHEVVEKIPDKIALLFVDGDHFYEAVKRDLLAYLPKMQNGGIVIMHDWSHNTVRKAIVEILQPSELKRLTCLPNLYSCRVAYRH